MSELMDVAAIPLLIFVICLYYGFRLIFRKDASTLWTKNLPELKDEEKYCVNAGYLFLFFGFITLLMGILQAFVNVYVGIGVSVVGIIIFVILWKKMSDKYGPIHKPSEEEKRK